MINTTGLRHFGKWQRNDVIIAGFNDNLGVMLVVLLDQLPADDRAQLIELAASPTAQANEFLLDMLNSSPHRSGLPWAHHISRLILSKRGAVPVHLKDIEGMNPQQKDYFNNRLRRDLREATMRSEETGTVRTPVGQVISEAEKMAVLGPQYREVAAGAVPAPAAEPNTQITEALTALIQTQAQTNQMLAALIRQNSSSAPKTKRPYMRKPKPVTASAEAAEALA